MKLIRTSVITFLLFPIFGIFLLSFYGFLNSTLCRIFIYFSFGNLFLKKARKNVISNKHVFHFPVSKLLMRKTSKSLHTQNFLFHSTVNKKINKREKSKFEKYNDKVEKKLSEFKVCFSFIKTRFVKKTLLIEAIAIRTSTKSYFYKDLDSYFLALKNDFKGCLIYFHKFGSFNSSFLIKYFASLDKTQKKDIKVINRNGLFYEVCLPKYKIQFRDYSLLIPGSLKDIAADFGRKYVDLNWDNKKKYSYKKIFDLCRNNCKILQDVFFWLQNKIWNKFGINIISNLTLPSLSLSIFKKHYYDPSLASIYKNAYEIDHFIRKSYYGCIQEVKKPFLSDGFCYDVNGLYPAVMAKKKLPVGKCRFTKGHLIDIKNFIGFVYCRVICNNNADFLVYEDSKRGLITPRGSWTGIYYAKEIRKAIKLGYQFKFLHGVQYFEEKIIFDKFVHDMYSLKQNSKNNTEKRVFKSILTTLHGRFGMSVFKKRTKMDSYKDSLQLKLKYTISSLQCVANDLLVSTVQNKAFNKKQLYGQTIFTDTAVQLASAITAEARMFMYDFRNLPGNESYYTNVDCIFLKKKLNNFFVCSNELGKFKFKGKIKEGYFMAPGNFLIKNQDDKIEISLKRIKKNSYDDQKVLNSFQHEISNGKDNPGFKVTQKSNFVRVLPSFEIQIVNKQYIRKVDDQKRIKVRDLKDQMWTRTSSHSINTYSSLQKHSFFHENYKCCKNYSNLSKWIQKILSWLSHE